VIYSYNFGADFIFALNVQSMEGGNPTALVSGNYIYSVDPSSTRVIYCVAPIGIGSGNTTCRSLKYDNTGDISLLAINMPVGQLFVDGNNGFLIAHSAFFGAIWVINLVPTIGGTVVKLDSGVSSNIVTMAVDTVNQYVVYVVQDIRTLTFSLKSISYAGGIVGAINLLDTSSTSIPIYGFASAEKLVFYSAATIFKANDVTGQPNSTLSIETGVTIFTVVVDEGRKTVIYSLKGQTYAVKAFDFNPPATVITTSPTFVAQYFLYIIIIVPILVFFIIVGTAGCIYFLVRRKRRSHMWELKQAYY